MGACVYLCVCVCVCEREREFVCVFFFSDIAPRDHSCFHEIVPWLLNYDLISLIKMRYAGGQFHNDMDTLFFSILQSFLHTNYW